MRETRVIDVQAAPLISKVQVVNFDPPTLLVNLETPMANVSSVSLNGKSTSNFVFSPGTNSLLVEIGIEDSLQDIRVLGTPRSMDGAYVAFRFQGARQVIGTERLLQRIARLSQTRAGSLLGHPEIHGYVDLGVVDETGHEAIILHTFRHIQDLIRQAQAAEPGVFPAERLVEIRVVGVLKNSGGDYKVVLQVVTEDGTLVRLLSWEAPVQP